MSRPASATYRRPASAAAASRGYRSGSSRGTAVPGNNYGWQARFAGLQIQAAKPAGYQSHGYVGAARPDSAPNTRASSNPRPAYRAAEPPRFQLKNSASSSDRRSTSSRIARRYSSPYAQKSRVPVSAARHAGSKASRPGSRPSSAYGKKASYGVITGNPSSKGGHRSGSVGNHSSRSSRSSRSSSANPNAPTSNVSPKVASRVSTTSGEESDNEPSPQRLNAAPRRVDAHAQRTAATSAAATGGHRQQAGYTAGPVRHAGAGVAARVQGNGAGHRYTTQAFTRPTSATATRRGTTRPQSATTRSTTPQHVRRASDAGNQGTRASPRYSRPQSAGPTRPHAHKPSGRTSPAARGSGSRPSSAARERPSSATRRPAVSPATQAFLLRHGSRSGSSGEPSHAASGSGAAAARSRPSSAHSTHSAHSAHSSGVPTATRDADAVLDRADGLQHIDAEQRMRLKRYVSSSNYDGRSSTDFYKFGKVLGQGSFAKVRLAWHKLTGVRVAVKSYDKSKLTQPAHWRRTQQEIRLMERLNHPNVIRMLETLESPKRIHIVMEHAGGGNLCKYVKARKRLGEADARSIFVQLMLSVDYLHNIGIIHRDIKLENVLFDENRNMKLVDFGFSVGCRDPTKMLKIFCGTPSYMAPEIVMRQQYAGRPVDVWSLGVLLYAMLCGMFPFVAKSYPELYKKIVRAQLNLPDHMSHSVKDLLRRMLHPDAKKRVTLAQIRRHAWCAAPVNAMLRQLRIPQEHSLRQSEQPEHDLYEVSIIKLQELGFQRERIIQAIRSKSRNHVGVAYYLMLYYYGRSRAAQHSKELYLRRKTINEQLEVFCGPYTSQLKLLLQDRVKQGVLKLTAGGNEDESEYHRNFVARSSRPSRRRPSLGSTSSVDGGGSTATAAGAGAGAGTSITTGGSSTDTGGAGTTPTHAAGHMPGAPPAKAWGSVKSLPTDGEGGGASTATATGTSTTIGESTVESDPAASERKEASGKKQAANNSNNLLDMMRYKTSEPAADVAVGAGAGAAPAPATATANNGGTAKSKDPNFEGVLDLLSDTSV